MSGYWAVGSFVIATAPAMVMRIAMTIATIGRRMKNSAMDCPLPLGLFGGLRLGCFALGSFPRRRRSLRRVDGHSGSDPLQPLHDDLVSGLQALLDDPHVPVDRAGLDDLDRDLVVRPDDRDLVAALELRHRALRHEDRALLDVQGDADLGV